MLDIDFFVPPSRNQAFSICINTFKNQLNISMLSFQSRLDTETSKEIFSKLKEELKAFIEQKNELQLLLV